MTPSRWLLAGLVLLVGQALARSEGPAPASPPGPADGVYEVRRDGAREKDVLPLREGEAVVVDRHPYAKKDEAGPPRFLVVRSAPDVPLDLAGEPRADREGAEVVRVLFRLKPRAAEALQRLTSDARGRQLAVVLGGEVVTVHKVRAAITGGEVQVTSCAPGGAAYLLERLRAHVKGR